MSPKLGARYPVEDLLAMTRLPITQIARTVGFNAARVRRLGLNEDQADRAAIAFQLHPAEVWPQWPIPTPTCPACGGELRLLFGGAGRLCKNRRCAWSIGVARLGGGEVEP